MTSTDHAEPRAAAQPEQLSSAEAREPFDVRGLTATARLAPAMAGADGDARRRLRAAIYAIVYPIVFTVVTRRIEIRRSHRVCLRGFRHLTATCLDAFQDDVEAVIDHLLAARTPIADLDAWLAYWAPRAAVDGHRRRRGERGALQRPRMTKALAAGLGHDRWLMDLALQILTWVGVPANAGESVWPLDDWSHRRALLTGDHAGSTPRVVEAEVGTVLAVMRRRPDWFEAHVERPLGRKNAVLGPPPGDNATDPRPLPAAEPDELDDMYSRDLASIALAAIEARLRTGRTGADAVLPVLSALFVKGTGAELIGRAPGAGRVDDERLSALFADRLAAGRLVGRVLDIVQQGGHDLVDQ